MPNLEVHLGDKLDQPALYDVERPSRLCTAADKNDEGVSRPQDALMCYRIKRVAKMCVADAGDAAGQACRREEDCGGATRLTRWCMRQPKHDSVRDVHVSDQFGARRVDTVGEEELCVRSTISSDAARMR
jgi:hypothetical protein